MRNENRCPWIAARPPAGFVGIAGLLLLIFITTGCQGLRTRGSEARRSGVTTLRPAEPGKPDSEDQEPMETVAPSGSDAPHAEESPGSPGTPPPAIPRIGLILGPGGARAYAHIGVLQEFQREKIPVTAIAGIEWGAPIAALYALKGSVNEAEWQMSKFKADDLLKKSLIGSSSKPADPRVLKDFLHLAFGSARVEGSRVPFVCPALNLQKNQVFAMHRGVFEQLLPYCMSYPPLLRSWSGNVAAVREVKAVADQLRAQGANVVVLVNVLWGPNPTRSIGGDEGTAEALLWNEIAHTYSRGFAGVDHVLAVPIGAAPVSAFDQRRELQRKGAEMSASPIRALARRLRL